MGKITKKPVFSIQLGVDKTLKNFAPAKFGEQISAPARVLKEYEHKGHRFGELDVIVTANGDKVVSRVHHTAIYRPRQVTGD